MKFWKKALIILFLVAAITAFPLMYLKNSDFSGTDNQAKTAITEIDADYKPWISTMFQPSAETESMLFALQAAIGAGVIGFGFGRLTAKKRSKEEVQHQGGEDERN